MHRILSILLLLLVTSYSFSQEYFLKKPVIGDSGSSIIAIDNYDDDYLIGGLTVFGDTMLYLYMGVMDDNGEILQYDLYPQNDFILSIDRNNDFQISRDGNYWNSTGSGRTILYNYQAQINQLMAIDTFETYKDEFVVYDFRESLFT